MEGHFLSFGYEAKILNDTHRFFDDIHPKNNFDNFKFYKHSIYFPGMIIIKENSEIG